MTQNDIIGIYSTNGVELIKYFYDAWGNMRTEIVDTNENMSYTDNVQKLETLAKLNPFRYRGYIYDEERIVVIKRCYKNLILQRIKNEKQDVYDNFLLFVSFIDLFVDNGCWESAVNWWIKV